MFLDALERFQSETTPNYSAFLDNLKTAPYIIVALVFGLR